MVTNPRISSSSVQFGLLSIFIFSTFIFSSCGNETATIKSSVTQSASTQSNDTLQKLMSDNKLPILYMTETEFRSIPKGDKRKLELDFCLTDTGKGFFTLIAYPSKKNRYEDQSLYLHNELGIYPTTLNPNQINILGGQKLSKNKLKIINDALGPNASDNQFVVFYPKRDLQNFHISFDVYVFNTYGEIKQKAVPFVGKLTETNPSPPASDEPENDN